MARNVRQLKKQTLADKFCHLASERLRVYGTEDGEADDNVDGALVFGEEVQQGLGGLMGEIGDDIDIGHPHLGEDGDDDDAHVVEVEAAHEQR